MTKKNRAQVQCQEKQNYEELDSEQAAILIYMQKQHLLRIIKSIQLKLTIVEEQINCATRNKNRAFIRLETSPSKATVQDEFALRERELDRACNKYFALNQQLSDLKDELYGIQKQEPRELFKEVVIGLNKTFEGNKFAKLRV